MDILFEQEAAEVDECDSTCFNKFEDPINHVSDMRFCVGGPFAGKIKVGGVTATMCCPVQYT